MKGIKRTTSATTTTASVCVYFMSFVIKYLFFKFEKLIQSGPGRKIFTLGS